jgi:hypothetical protein
MKIKWFGKTRLCVAATHAMPYIYLDGLNKQKKNFNIIVITLWRRLVEAPLEAMEENQMAW